MLFTIGLGSCVAVILTGHDICWPIVPLPKRNSTQVMVPPPDDGEPVLFALADVRDSADSIATSANAFLVTPPDDTIPPEFLGAVGSVKNSAQDIVNTAQRFIRQIIGEVPTDP